MARLGRGFPSNWQLRIVRNYASFADGAGSSSLTFAADATGSSLADASASSALTFTVSGTGSSLADASATSSLTFAPSGTGASLTDAAGSATLTFSVVGASPIEGLVFFKRVHGPRRFGLSNRRSRSWTVSKVRLIPFAAREAVTADGAGSSSLTFTTSATGATFADGAGSSSLTFTVSGTGASLASADGSSSLTFTVSGTGASLASTDGSSSLTFTVAGVGQAVSTEGAGSSSLTFTVEGVGDRLIFGGYVPSVLLRFRRNYGSLHALGPMPRVRARGRTKRRRVIGEVEAMGFLPIANCAGRGISRGQLLMIGMRSYGTIKATLDTMPAIEKRMIQRQLLGI